jgi:hypothetical protein
VTTIHPQQGPNAGSRRLPWPRRAVGGPAGARRIDEPYAHRSVNPIDRALDRVIDADLQRRQRIALARLPRPGLGDLADLIEPAAAELWPTAAAATTPPMTPSPGAAPPGAAILAQQPARAAAAPAEAATATGRPRIDPFALDSVQRRSTTADRFLVVVAAVALVIGFVLACQLA